MYRKLNKLHILNLCPFKVLFYKPLWFKDEVRELNEQGEYMLAGSSHPCYILVSYCSHYLQTAVLVPGSGGESM